MKIRKWYDKNNFNWDCAPRLGFAIELKHIDLFCFSFYGFKRQKQIYPYASKIYFSFSILRKELGFRVGIQNKTWLWIRCCEFHNLICRIRNYKKQFPF